MSEAFEKENEACFESYEFTQKRDNDYFDLADLETFKKHGTKVIFEALKEQMHSIPFSDYLKRLIYFKAEFTGKYDEIDNETYRKFIVDSFKKTNTPSSLKPSTTRISAAAKNWLKQATVSRETVFVLGFGLQLTEEEVSELLIKGIKEGDFYFKNPYESIYWYCYKNGLGFNRMNELKAAYKQVEEQFKEALVKSETFNVKAVVKSVKSGEELLEVLAANKLVVGLNCSDTARREFESLYRECQEIVRKQNSFGDSELDIDCALYKRESRILGRNISDEKKARDYKGIKQLINDKKKKRKEKRESEEISTVEVENLLCEGIPKTDDGNLVKVSESSLAVISEKRLTRQRISEILSGVSPVNRYDLITLKFFVFSESNLEADSNDRCWRFCGETNELLERCSMGGLYTPNPFDCFVQLCMMTDDPIYTFQSVNERAYNLSPLMEGGSVIDEDAGSEAYIKSLF